MSKFTKKDIRQFLINEMRGMGMTSLMPINQMKPTGEIDGPVAKMDYPKEIPHINAEMDAEACCMACIAICQCCSCPITKKRILECCMQLLGEVCS